MEAGPAEAKPAPKWSTGLAIYSVFIFAILWVGFILVLIVDQALLDDIWRSMSDLPVIVEVAVWILFLPITVGLWVWESSWPSWLRLVGLAGIAVWTGFAIASFVGLIRSRRSRRWAESKSEFP